VWFYYRSIIKKLSYTILIECKNKKLVSVSCHWETFSNKNDSSELSHSNPSKLTQNHIYFDKDSLLAKKTTVLIHHISVCYNNELKYEKLKSLGNMEAQSKAPLKPPDYLQHYGIERLKRIPQIGPHYAERCKPLGQRL